jgi:hypothetical protein
MFGYVVGIIGQVAMFLLSLGFIARAIGGFSRGTFFAIWTGYLVSLIVVLLTFYGKQLHGENRKRSSFFLFAILLAVILAGANNLFQIVGGWWSTGLSFAVEGLIITLVGSAIADRSVEGPRRAKTGLVLISIGLAFGLLRLVAPAVPSFIGSFLHHLGMIFFIVSMFADDPKGGSGGGGSYYSGSGSRGYGYSTYTYTYTVKYWYPN